jgi:cellulose 1,4-beta-cellobiosidase
VRRGYIRASWYLIDVEAGFELWHGGAGLATKSFSVNVAKRHRRA